MIAGCSEQRRDDNKRVFPRPLERVTGAVGNNNERSGSDRSRRVADPHGSLPGDDIDDFVAAFMDMLRDPLAHLEQTDSLQRVARQNRFLERFSADQVSIEKINNRDGHGRTAWGNHGWRRWLGSGFGRWWRSEIQHNINL